MNPFDRLPSLKHIAVWLTAISFICFAIGGVITVIDGGNYTSQAEKKVLPVSIPYQGARDALVALEIECGSVNITSGDTDALVSGVIKTRNPHDGLHQSYSVVNGTGMLTITQDSSNFFDPLEQDECWNLSLDPDVPTALSIKNGAGNISVATGCVPLTSLKIEVGAGDVNLDLSGWKGVHLPLTIDEGIGSLVIRLPEAATIGADIRDGLGSRMITGFEGGDGHYFRTSLQPGAPVISLVVGQGVGDLTMKTIPENP